MPEDPAAPGPPPVPSPPDPPHQRPAEYWDPVPMQAPALVDGAMTMAEVQSAPEPEEKEDRFRTWVAIAIAAISILGAVVAFNGTLAEQDARKLDQQGIQDASRRQQVITDLQATVDQDLRFLAPYQEHIKAAKVLDDQAKTLEASDPNSASLLHAEAQSERVLARSWLRFFRVPPATGAADGPVQYDPKAALQRLEIANYDLQQLRPEATFAQADARHTASVRLVGLVTLFVAALLFLTLAQFTRPAIRRIFAAAGGVVAVTAALLWVVVLRALA